MEKDKIIANQIEKSIGRSYDRSMAIIGLGNIGLAFAQGLQASDEFAEYSLNVSNGNKERTEEKLAGIKHSDNLIIAEDNFEAVHHSHFIFLALKQAALKELLQEMREQHVLSDDKLLISLAAGVCIDTIKKWAGNTEQPVARIMPNTAASVGKGVFGWTVSDEVTVGDAKTLRTVCDSLGVGVLVDGDEGIDTITALSGSGIAYFFEMGNQLQQAAIQLGMNEKEAARIVKQTLLGAAMKAVNEEDDFATLRRKVTSPKGTTEKALSVFDSYQFGELMQEAVGAAKMRAEQIGKEFSEI